MTRWHKDASRTDREWRKHVWMIFFVGGCACDKQKGHFRKRKAFATCQNSRCRGCCNTLKYPRRVPTVPELRASEEVEEFKEEFNV
jgi:hypothetical protein